MYDPAKFRTILKGLMQARGLSPTTLAAALSPGATPCPNAGTIRRWLRQAGKLPPPTPSIHHLLALAHYFGVSVDDLLGASRAPATLSAPAPPASPLPTIMYKDKPLIRLVREPRKYEQAGVEIARRLSQGQLPADVMATLHYGQHEETRFQADLKAAAYGDLLQVETGSVATNPNLEKWLKDKYDLNVCIVAKVDDLHYGVLITVILGALAADYVRAQALPDLQYCIGIARRFELRQAGC